MRVKSLIICLLITFQSLAQYAPQAGLPGSSAIPASSPVFTGWARYATISRGYIELGDTNLSINGSNRASFGSVENVYGPADGKPVSLGDKGTITIFLSQPVYDGPGWDFAVFENGFRSITDSTMAFLELAYVSVSSDGKLFFTFPSISLTQDTAQIDGFGMLKANKIYDLAGKYIAGYGVPFDLSELSDFQNSGLDLNNIHYIRIQDVGGCINPICASYDSQGHIINDPYPTPFASSGFDLDAVGLIHQRRPSSVYLYPNPTAGIINIQSNQIIKSLLIKDIQGNTILRNSLNVNFFKLNLSNLKSGLYFCILREKDLQETAVIIKL